MYVLSPFISHRSEPHSKMSVAWCTIAHYTTVICSTASRRAGGVFRHRDLRPIYGIRHLGADRSGVEIGSVALTSRPGQRADPAPSGGGAEADPGLLDHGNAQFARLGVDLTPGQPAGAGGRGRLLRVQQPLIGPEGPVEPHRVIQARTRRAAAEPGL